MAANSSAVSGSLLADDPRWLKVNPLYLEGDNSREEVYAVELDANGYLWLGTGNGLKRYDGYAYTVFLHESGNPDSLASSGVYSLLIDSAETLWVGSRSLSAYKPETQTFDNYDVTGDNGIRAMAETADHMLWISAESLGVLGFDTRKREIVYRSPETARNSPNSVFEIINDRFNSSILWMVTTVGLYRFDTRSREFELVYSNEALGGARPQLFSTLAMDRDGKIWMTTETGLYVIDPQNRRFRHYRHEPGNPAALSSDILAAVFIDSRERIWIGTDKTGVHLYRPKTDDFLHIPASTNESGTFGPGTVTDIEEDPNGSLWFAVFYHNVQRISDRLEKFINIRAGKGERALSWDSLLDLHEDHHGDIWIATDGGGLNRYNPRSGRIIKYFHDPDDPSSLSSNSVLSLAEDDQGRLWIGTWAGGLDRLDPNTGEFVHYRHDLHMPENRKLAGDNVFQVVKDEQGWLWLSIWNFGLQRFNPRTGEFISFSYRDKSNPFGITNGSVNANEASRYGFRWVGGYQGLENYHPDTQRFTPVELNEEMEIYDLYEDRQGILWVAAAKGLIRYDPTTGDKKTYTQADGMADSYVVSIEEDNNGFLWLGTRGGLSRFDKKQQTFKNFDKNDGLAGHQFNRYAHLYSRDGLMYFGGTKGLTLFDPQNMAYNSNPPKVALTGLELSQEKVVPGRSPFLPKQISLLDKLVLPYTRRDVTFEFSALNFIAPSKNRYRYRLKGFEENWGEVDSSRRRARYTNLDPGHYQFQVIASNNDGVWNEQGATVNLLILTPWWMTWWARTLAVVLGLCAIAGFVNWRLRLYRRHQKELSAEIKERRTAQAELLRIAYHDVLTGLPNRLWLLRQLDTLIANTRSGKQRRFALLFMDGDRFKQINDTYGHQLGDQLLKSVSMRLKTLLPERCHAVRLGGDEFTVLVEQLESEDQVIEICNRIIAAFNKAFRMEKGQLFFRVSIGVVFCGNQYDYPGQVLRDADIAMYKAKELGRHTYQVFDAEMRGKTLEVSQLESDLYTALKENQLFLVYQPIINLQNEGLIGFEALSRWNHPEKGLIPPDKFIPIAEESGLIYTLGSWVLRQACTQMAAWIKEYKLEKPPAIAINLSSLELNQPYFLAQVDQMLLETGIDSSLLKLEITESVLMEHSESMNALLDELRARRIQLAIDDFGTGYSSLSYLDQLPVQVLKIDREFVNALTDPGEDNPSSVEIVSATISLAHNLGIKVVAEGIETKQQFQQLKSYGCDFGQGYYIAKPLSSEAAAQFMGYASESNPNVRVTANSDVLPDAGSLSVKRRRYRGE